MQLYTKNGPLSDEDYIKRCITLAQNGRGNVSPNPMVGAVVVHNGKIIGEGYHQKCGEAHAEVNAINNVEDKSLLKSSTIYVSLEPCSHHGKTPPCSDLIIRMGIPKVVIGCIDTFSEVAGRGIEKLRNHGIEVTVGVLETESRNLNRRFFTFHEKKRPYIILKWAQSKDGFIDKDRETNEKGVNWITQPETQQLTHKWRSEEDAILVGTNTVIIDNPSLSVRAVEGRNPIRVVIAKDLDRLPSESKVFNQESSTIFFNESLDQTNGNITSVKVDFNGSIIEQVLAYLHREDIQSLIIEGGAKTLQSFMDANLWDEARVLTGDVIFEKGIAAPKINSNFAEEFKFGKDLIKTYYND